MTTASAPGKIILVGEHAVVYGRPAIAVPISKVKATATVEEAARGTGCVIIAKDLNRTIRVIEAGPEDPLAAIVRSTLAHFHAQELDATITVTSTIPIASGMGSGAAVSTAIVRALAGHLGHTLNNDILSALVFEVEKLYHGTPSGVDNTVIAHARPVFFVKNRLVETFTVKLPLYILIADTGVLSPTKTTVGDVRQAWETNQEKYDTWFRQVGQIALMARAAIIGGEPCALGALMDGNQWLLEQMGVSSPEIDRLVQAARQAGALGAKLSGAGRGGNVIALAADQTRGAIANTLREAGAKNVIAATIA
jgi:mevalonate kinase